MDRKDQKKKSRSKANSRYFRINRNSILTKQKKYREEHKERILARRREIYQKNKIKKEQ